MEAVLKIIALVNQKGGVGKTTTAVNLADGLSRRGAKVLLIDLDPQSNATYSLGIQSHTLEGTVYEMLKNEASFPDVVIKRGGFDLVPSSLGLATADLTLSGLPGRENLLKDALSNVEGYDFILIDCPPSLGLLTLNALTYAREVIISIQTEFLALQGVRQLWETVEMVKRRLNDSLEITGVVCTRYDSRRNLNQDIAAHVREFFKEKVFNTMIRENVALGEAPSYGKTIFEYKPRSHGATDYGALCDEILKQGEGE